MELQPARPRHDLLDEAGRRAGITLGEETDVYRKAVGGLQHSLNVPGSRRARRRVRSGGGTGPASHQRRHPGKQGLVDLLRADEVHMHVDAAGRDDLAFAGNDFGTGADDDRYVWLYVGIAGFANRSDPAVTDAYVGLHDSPVIKDQGIRDHGVDRAVDSRALRLSHAITDDFSAAEFHLLAVRREVLLHLDEEVGICETHLVADGRAEHLCVRRT